MCKYFSNGKQHFYQQSERDTYNLIRLNDSFNIKWHLYVIKLYRLVAAYQDWFLNHHYTQSRRA